MIRLSILQVALSAVFTTAQAASLPAPQVHVRKQDSELIVDVVYSVPVKPQVVWNVMTDFENMPGFVPNLDESKVLQRSAKGLLVQQKGHFNFGILSLPYTSKREIEVTPIKSVRSHSVSGPPMDSTTTLAPTKEGTLVVYHATLEPDFPAPFSTISSSLQESLEEQFAAMGKEMMARANSDDENADSDDQELGKIGQQTGSRPAAAPPRQPSSRTARAMPSASPAKTAKRVIKPSLPVTISVKKPAG